MDVYASTDLACESMPRGEESRFSKKTHVEKVGNFRVLEIQLDEEDSRLCSKPCGSYTTVECGRIHLLSDADLEMLTHLLSGRLRGMSRHLTKKNIDRNFVVFVAGLGNAAITADAIGPQAVALLEVTRHLREYERDLYESLDCSALCALAPGVLGETGIETLELLRGAVSHVRPDLVVVIDALAARSCERLAATVQISDVGIVPGSGVGNHRLEISKKTLGVPVVSVGVPTVVNSATLVCDALRQAGVEEIPQALESVLQSGKSFFVSPKESDVITKSVSHLIAGAISMAFTGL